MEPGVSEVTIQVRDNGNYKISGRIRIVDAEGNELVLPPGTAVTLCRCGHSETKPFCDGSHRRVGFESVVRAPGPFGAP
jgi:CDGSH-type Zn-finger protein